MKEIIAFVLLITILVLLCIYIDNKIMKGGSQNKKGSEQGEKDDEKKETVRKKTVHEKAVHKEENLDFKQQLNQLVLSKEETIKREEEKERQAQEEKRRQVEEEKRALENKI